jgi:hypothetical protein
MKTKQYVAFLQTSQRHDIVVRAPANSRLNKIATNLPVTDKITLMVEAPNPDAARTKIRDMFAVACRNDPDMRGVKSVSLLHLVEITRVPASGLVLRHETVVELPSLNCPLDAQPGARQIQLGEEDAVLWPIDT